jgi:nucleotide-binding universal stress UspA family protein
MFNTVVLATDGSTNGDRAVELVKLFAQQARSKIVVVHVTELVGGRGGTYPVAADEEEILAKIKAQVADLNAAGVAARLTTRVVSFGGPAHVITAAADSVGADLIVVGSRGHSPLAQVVLGSVPVRLLPIATCPVLVVPPPER